MAPGVEIAVADGHFKTGYGIVDGTSPAAAMAAGGAALIRAKYPRLSARDVVARRTSTAVDKGPRGRDDAYGYGELNPIGALAANPPPTASPTGAAPGGARPAGTGTGAVEPDAQARGVPVLVYFGIGLAVLLLAVAAGMMVARRRGTRRA